MSAIAYAARGSPSRGWPTDPGLTRYLAAAHDGHRIEGLDACDDGVGVGAVADQIAENERAIVAAPGCLGEAGAERLEVRVDIGEDEVAHQCMSEEMHKCMDARMHTSKP